MWWQHTSFLGDELRMWPFSIPLLLGQLHSVFQERPSVHCISMSPDNGILWLPRLGTCNVHADVNTPECTLGPYKSCKRVDQVDQGRHRHWQHNIAAGHATAKHQDFCGMAVCARSKSSHAILPGCGVVAGYTQKGHDDNDVELHVLGCRLTY